MMADSFSNVKRDSGYLFSKNRRTQKSPRHSFNSVGRMEDCIPLDSHPFEKKLCLGYRNKSLRKLLFPHEFESKELEKLFQLYSYPSCFEGLRCLLILMIALTVSLSIVNFVFVSRLSLENIANSSLCLSFVVILICIHTRFMTHNLLSIVQILVVMLCLVFCAVSFAVDEQTLSPGFDHKINLKRIMSSGFTFSRVEAVWRLCYVMFVLYAFVPLKFYIPVGVALFTSLLHSLLAVFLPSHQSIISPVLSKQVVANMFVFLILNVVCIFSYRMRERQMRSTFHLIRSSIAHRLKLQDENDKADKLLASMIPANIALELKGDLQAPHLRDYFQKVYIQKYDSVSILFGDITGLNMLACQCSALEVVRFLNEAVGRFDQLATENHCHRIQLQGGRYFCISGIMDQRPDHAKCCVEMGIDMIDFINFVGTLTSINLGMRVGVHSGHVTCGLVGVRNWRYDTWSEHVDVASLTEKAGQIGKVLVTETTILQLHGEFPIIVNKNNCSKLEALGIKTYFVVNEHSRKHYFLPKTTPTTKNIGGVLSAIKFNVEQPLSNIVSRTFISSDNSFEDAEVFEIHRSGKRQASFMERHKKHLMQMIANKSLKMKKTDHVNYLSLSFKSSILQRSASEDAQFASMLFLTLVILVMSMIIHALILPRTIFLLVFFLVCFAWISVVLMLVLGYRIRCVLCDVRQSHIARRSIVLICILLHFVMSFINTLCCKGGIVFPAKVISPSESVVSFHHPSHLECSSPQYIYLNILPCLLLVLPFNCLTISMKLSIWLLMSIAYLMIMEFANRAFFFNYDSKLGTCKSVEKVLKCVFVICVGTLDVANEPKMIKILNIKMELTLELKLNLHSICIEKLVLRTGILMLLHFVIALYLSSRDLDWLLRLKHVWIVQVKKQKLDVNTLENINQDLFHNLLPDHVVPYFNNVPENKIIDFYSQSYLRVAVMQASVTNLSHILNELTKRSRNVECLRILHEIISAFDRVQFDPRFTSTTKIKSSGPSYLVTAGLKPNNKIDDTKESKRLYLNIITELALKMKESLISMCNGRLVFRAGIDLGPAIVGVIGARKPQYEIIGDCINTACLLSLTSTSNCVQVTKVVYESINGCYEFKCRGMTKLKITKEQLTYLIIGPNPRKLSNFFESDKDEGLTSSQFSLDQNHFTRHPIFDHSIKRPQPITPQTPLKIRNGCSSFTYTSENNQDRSQACSENIAKFSPNIWSHIEYFETHDQMNIAKSRYSPKSQNAPKSGAFSSIGTGAHHSSAFVPTSFYNENSLMLGSSKTSKLKNVGNNIAMQTSKCTNDNNNNNHPNHLLTCNQKCLQSVAIPIVTTTADPHLCQSQIVQAQSLQIKKGDISSFWKNGDISKRIASVGDKEIGFYVDEKDEIVSGHELHDIEAVKKEAETASKTNNSDFCLSEDLEHLTKNGVSPEAHSCDENEVAEDELIENGVIYTKKCVDSQLSCKFVTETNKPFSNSQKTKPSVKKFRDVDGLFSFTNNFIRDAGPLVQQAENLPKTVLFPVKGSKKDIGNKSSQDVKTSFQGNGNVSLAKTLLAANLTAKLRLHQQISQNDFGKRCSVKSENLHHKGDNSRCSMALPLQSPKSRKGHSSSPLRSKSLDRITIEISDEMNSSSSLGDSSPKMLQRTSNRRNISTLCADVKNGENQKMLGSGFLRVKHTHNQKSKLRNNHKHSVLTSDCLSLSSFNSEISRSDPALSYESSSAMESEYDNYRPGMASDEDYFPMEPVSDVEIDIFDDANVDKVKVDEGYENCNFGSLIQCQPNRPPVEQ